MQAHATLKQASTVPAPVSDEQRLEQLRTQAQSNPDVAKEAAWALLRELQEESQFHRLPWLFAQGNGPPTRRTATPRGW